MNVILEKLPGHFDKRPKLLIVDDQALNIQVIHALFKEECDIFMATSGQQAIALAQSQLPDLILLDVMMPGMDGHEVCRRLKADPATLEIPIIFLTAQLNISDEVAGFEVGAVDFITKPVNPVIVKARVNTHLVLKRQTDALKSLALMDGLTHVANRRKFDEELHANWLQATRKKEVLSLIMMDVDFFKKYNDFYGHQQGDECLRQVASALKQMIRRPYDLLARYGGEEFACILPDTDSTGAAYLAQQMLAQVRGLNIEHANSVVDHIVTISLGVASLHPQQDQAPDILIKAADQALYKAKANGRSTVSIGSID